MKEDLQGVPATMLIPLWARAAETRCASPIIRDEKAVEMVAGMDYDFSVFEDSKLTQLGVAVRTKLLDDGVRAFTARNPGGVVVNLGSGLDTRFERLRDADIAFWCDLDVPEGLDIRRGFFSEGDKNGFIAGSAFDTSWIDEIDVRDRPLLIIAEGLLMYFEEAEVKRFFITLAERLPGAEMLFEMLAPFLVGRSAMHETVSKLGDPVEFKWGLGNTRSMASWSEGIEFIEEWDYYDTAKPRWGWFGRLGRFPLVRPKLSNRIVHLRFTAPGK